MSTGVSRAPVPRVLVVGGVVLLFLVVRLAALDADPPPWLSWSTGLYTDEGFYTLDARHVALFGTWAPGNFHDRLLSPLLSLLQQGAFAVLGPSLRTARLLAILFGLVTVFVLWLGLRETHGTRVADYGALFLGLAPPFVLYNRLALQETPTVFWLVLCFTLWACGCRAKQTPKQAALFAGAGAALGIAFVFKALAIVALPAFVWACRRAAASRLASGWGACGLLVVLVLYGLLWYVPHAADLTRMSHYYRTHQYQPHSARTVWLNVRRGFVGGERGVFPYLLAFLPVPVLLAGWGMMGRPRPAGSGVLMAWLLCGLGFCLLSTYAPDRYYVLFMPPLAALAACGLVRLQRPKQLAAMGLFLVTCGIWDGKAWTGRTYVRQQAARQLAHLLPPGSVVVGNDAPALCLDTALSAAPVQPGLSNDDHPVDRLHARAVAVTRAPAWQTWWQAHDPRVVQPSQHLAVIREGGFRHYIVDIDRVP